MKKTLSIISAAALSLTLMTATAAAAETKTTVSEDTITCGTENSYWVLDKSGNFTQYRTVYYYGVKNDELSKEEADFLTSYADSHDNIMLISSEKLLETVNAKPFDGDTKYDFEVSDDYTYFYVDDQGGTGSLEDITEKLPVYRLDVDYSQTGTYNGMFNIYTVDDCEITKEDVAGLSVLGNFDLQRIEGENNGVPYAYYYVETFEANGLSHPTSDTPAAEAEEMEAAIAEHKAKMVANIYSACAAALSSEKVEEVYPGYVLAAENAVPDNISIEKISGVAAAEVETPAAAVINGDTNGDEAVDSKDATVILIKYAEALNDDKTLKAEELPGGDFNGNGFVDSIDATDILIDYAERLIEE